MCICICLGSAISSVKRAIWAPNKTYLEPQNLLDWYGRKMILRIHLSNKYLQILQTIFLALKSKNRCSDVVMSDSFIFSVDDWFPELPQMKQKHLNLQPLLTRNIFSKPQGRKSRGLPIHELD